MKIKSINDNFFKNLRIIRKSLGFTQEEMAEQLNTTKQTIFRYEKGEIGPGLNILIHLLQDFKINLNWLLSDSEDTEEMFIQEIPAGYGVYEEEKKEMEYFMDHIPFVRSAMLKYFILFKHENKEEIQKFIEEHALNPLQTIG